MKMISREVVERLRAYCPPGTRVKLISMNDPYTKIEEGAVGTVTAVDDMGTVHVNWDNGSTLGLVYGEDQYAVWGLDLGKEECVGEED